MNFPPELLDEIFSYLSEEDKETLRACSLVARSWVYPAQRLLFRSVVLAENNFQLWRKRVRTKKSEPLNHVRSLHYFAEEPGFRYSHQRVDVPIRWLRSFHQLHTLTLSNLHARYHFSPDIFSAFQHNLSSLSLVGLRLPWSAFVTLIDYFPNLRDLKVHNPNFNGSDSRPETPSRSLRGVLSLTGLTDHAIKIFSNEISGMPVEYDTLKISPDALSLLTLRDYQLAIDACGGSLRHLILDGGEYFPRHFKVHPMGIF